MRQPGSRSACRRAPLECTAGARAPPDGPIHRQRSSEEASVGSERQQETAETLRQLGSATLGESGGLATDRRVKPAWSGASLAAPAYPVGCTPADNLAVHVAVTAAPR